MSKISSSKQRWFCIVADTWEVLDLGDHADFEEANDEAEERNPESTNWITDEEGARLLMANLQGTVNYRATPPLEATV
jgi:hypothetical protein